MSAIPPPSVSTTLYDKDGNAAEVRWSIDAREWVESGNWFYSPPAKPEKPKVEEVAVDQKSTKTLSLPK